MLTIHEAQKFNFTGAQVALICGEVTRKFELTYGDNKLARLTFVVTSKVPSKKAKSGFRYYNNRVSLWGKNAEEGVKQIFARNEAEGTAGTFIAVLSYIFGGEQAANGSWTHTFSAVMYKTFDDPDEMGNIIGNNQDPSILPIGAFFQS